MGLSYPCSTSEMVTTSDDYCSILKLQLTSRPLLLQPEFLLRSVSWSPLRGRAEHVHKLKMSRVRMRMYFQYANIFYPLLGVAEVVEHQEDGPHGELGSGDQDQEVAQSMGPLRIAVMLLYRVSHNIGSTLFFAILLASTLPKYKNWVSIKKFRKFATR